MIRRCFSFVVLLGMAVLLEGCTTQPLQSTATHLDPVRAEFDLAPRKLLEAARSAVTSPPLSLAIEDKGKGQFTTGWQNFEGEFHIARHWQERTRYNIIVTPDFENPTGRSTLQVTEETQQRRTDAQSWELASDLDRSARAQAILDRIREVAR